MANAEPRKLRPMFVRMPPELYERIRVAAAADYTNMSAWIRTVCQDELARRKRKEG